MYTIFHYIDLFEFSLVSPQAAVDTQAFLIRLCRGWGTVQQWSLFPVDTQLISTSLSRHGGYTMGCRGERGGGCRRRRLRLTCTARATGVMVATTMLLFADSARSNVALPGLQN